MGLQMSAFISNNCAFKALRFEDVYYIRATQNQSCLSWENPEAESRVFILVGTRADAVR